MARPTFSVEQTHAKLEFFVQDGVERRINNFVAVQDARRWIKAEAENWLIMRRGTPNFPQVGEEIKSPALAA
jgi:hypothetical protein